MIKRLVFVMAVVSWSLAMSGCGNSAGFFPVSGKVLYRGEPAAGAVVYFHRQASPGARTSRSPSASSRTTAASRSTCDDLGNGALPGIYRPRRVAGRLRRRCGRR